MLDEYPSGTVPVTGHSVEARVYAEDPAFAELCDRLGRAHADQIVRQIRALLARERRDDPPL